MNKNLREFVPSRSALQEMLKEVFKKNKIILIWNSALHEKGRTSVTWPLSLSNALLYPYNFFCYEVSYL